MSFTNNNPTHINLTEALSKETSLCRLSPTIELVKSVRRLWQKLRTSKGILHNRPTNKDTESYQIYLKTYALF